MHRHSFMRVTFTSHHIILINSLALASRTRFLVHNSSIAFSRHHQSRFTTFSTKPTFIIISEPLDGSPSSTQVIFSKKILFLHDIAIRLFKDFFWLCTFLFGEFIYRARKHFRLLFSPSVHYFLCMTTFIVSEEYQEYFKELGRFFVVRSICENGSTKNLGNCLGSNVPFPNPFRSPRSSQGC